MHLSGNVYGLALIHALAAADQLEGTAPGSHPKFGVPQVGVKPKLGVGRNEKCPCGSGKKFKRCCKDQ